MKQKLPGTSSHPRKVISPNDDARLLAFGIDDGLWKRIRTNIPDQLAPESEASLRADIERCCADFLGRCKALRDGGVTAEALKAPGKGELAPLDKLAKGLRMAADAWAEISGNAQQESLDQYQRRHYGKIHDDRLGDIRRYQSLEELARDAERRLNALRELGEPVTMTARPELVRDVKKCLRDTGLNPTVKGRVYDEKGGEPTWFQKFMAALNDNVLGNDGWGAPGRYSPQAFYSEIAKAFGDANRGNPKIL